VVHHESVSQVQARAGEFGYAPCGYGGLMGEAQIIFYGTLAYGRESLGVLGGILNSHPLALKHLMSCLMSFYIGGRIVQTRAGLVLNMLPCRGRVDGDAHPVLRQIW
jgi:hypothetical protein